MYEGAGPPPSVGKSSSLLKLGAFFMRPRRWLGTVGPLLEREVPAAAAARWAGGTYLLGVALADSSPLGAAGSSTGGAADGQFNP